MKKQAICVLAILLATVATGCGSRTGVSSPTKAAKQTIEAEVCNDVDKLIELIPEETLELLEEETHLTEKQIRDKVKSKTQEKLEKLKVKPKISGIKLKNKREEKDYSYLNKKLEKYYDVRAETAYYFDVEYTINKKFADEYNHGETKMKNEIGPIFEVDGKWYSSHVIETVGNLID